jgi:hypothetical protein
MRVIKVHDFSGPLGKEHVEAPAAGSGAAVTETATQTLQNKTLDTPAITNGVTHEVAAVVAAGTVQGDAAALAGAVIYDVTAADGTKGVKLPAAATGKKIVVYNNSANALKVYPASGDDINDGTVDVHVTIAPKCWAVFEAVDATTWASSAALASLAGTETLTNKTLTAPVLVGDVQILAAAGTVQGDAGAITVKSGGLVHVTGADATKGARLPAAAAGLIVDLKNDDAANAILKLYPATGDEINALGANTEISLAAKVSARFRAIDATTWFSIPLLPS